MVDKKYSEYLNALEYHQKDRPGKVSMQPTKPLSTQHDLALAYSPGVAAPCLEIHKNEDDIYKYTAKGNIVAVISNGTAVLGLGAIGAYASKPVMEGKSVLFKKFADIDSVDIEVDTQDPDEFINAIKYLGPSWGGINLEDIKAPECFIIEEKLKKLMNIPVFHDDQHGTAIISSAAIINALHLTNRDIKKVKMVVNGAGAAAIACINLIYKLGMPKENIILCDTKGVIYKGRTEGMNPWKEEKAIDTPHRTLVEALKGADIFMGLSVKGAVSQEMIKSMAASPIIFAMANPDPEITPEEIKSVRSDAIIATGRSDYNNQVNNVMGFPYIFRGALDVRATCINDEMKLAAAYALAELARQPVPNEVYRAYGGTKKIFGPEYIIPVPFDPRLISTISCAVAKAAIDSGVAKITDIDLKEYQRKLQEKLNPALAYTQNLRAKILNATKKRVIFAEGEEEEVIKAAILMRDENYAIPIIVGREERIHDTIKSLGSDYNLDGITIMNAAINPKINEYIEHLYNKLGRNGYLMRDCARMVKTDKNVFSACMLECGDADVLITGLTKSFYDCLSDIRKVIEPKQDQVILGYSVFLHRNEHIIISDNTICDSPNTDELLKITKQTAQISLNMGIKPKIALVSHSNFGNHPTDRSEVVRQVINKLDEEKADFEYEGEMSVAIALSKDLQQLYPCSRLTGAANVLIMPNLDSAAISASLLKQFSNGNFIGPILNGFSQPVQIVPINSSANEILQIAIFGIIEAIS
ncbi:MAG: NADP-dependent malic enzyme [Rickettsiaceae bacterium]|nr:NADP-dependent malic enzyme [Rickettsiaceae bacterium]